MYIVCIQYLIILKMRKNNSCAKRWENFKTCQHFGLRVNTSVFWCDTRTRKKCDKIRVLFLIYTDPAKDSWDYNLGSNAGQSWAYTVAKNLHIFIKIHLIFQRYDTRLTFQQTSIRLAILIFLKIKSVLTSS